LSIILNQAKHQLPSIGVSNFVLKIIDKTIGKVIAKNPLIFEFITAFKLI
jgi:hypothetical protein